MREHLDELVEGPVDWRADGLDILPEINRSNSTLGDAFGSEFKFLSCEISQYLAT